jgi:hypothetical protein
MHNILTYKQANRIYIPLKLAEGTQASLKVMDTCCHIYLLNKSGKICTEM